MGTFPHLWRVARGAAPELLREVFEIEAEVLLDAITGCPVVIPIRSLHAPTSTVEPADGATMVAD